MAVYTPDKWLVVQDTRNGDYRIMGSWYGGYATGDSFRLSSGVVSVTDGGDVFQVENYSGSFYNCLKNAEGLHMYSQEILDKHSDILVGIAEGEKLLTDMVGED